MLSIFLIICGKLNRSRYNHVTLLESSSTGCLDQKSFRSEHCRSALLAPIRKRYAEHTQIGNSTWLPRPGPLPRGWRRGSTRSAARVARGWQGRDSHIRGTLEGRQLNPPYSLNSTTSLANPSGISTRGHGCCTPAQGRCCLPAVHRSVPNSSSAIGWTSSHDRNGDTKTGYHQHVTTGCDMHVRAGRMLSFQTANCALCFLPGGAPL
jgi:hypothetical protein